MRRAMLTTALAKSVELVNSGTLLSTPGSTSSFVTPSLTTLGGIAGDLAVICVGLKKGSSGDTDVQSQPTANNNFVRQGIGTGGTGLTPGTDTGSMTIAFLTKIMVGGEGQVTVSAGVRQSNTWQATVYIFRSPTGFLFNANSAETHPFGYAADVNTTGSSFSATITNIGIGVNSYDMDNITQSDMLLTAIATPTDTPNGITQILLVQTDGTDPTAVQQGTPYYVENALGTDMSMATAAYKLNMGAAVLNNTQLVVNGDTSLSNNSSGVGAVLLIKPA